MKRNRFLLCFAFWLFVFHWWLVLWLIPPLREPLGPTGFKQSLYWINIPGIPLAHVMGPRYFEVEEFGALPHGPVAYGLIVLFWVFVAAILGAGTSAALCGGLQRKKDSDESSAA